MARAKNKANITELITLKKRAISLKMKELEKAKEFYQKLRNDENNILFGEDDLTNNIVKKL